jgi:hypothetical protein
VAYLDWPGLPSQLQRIPLEYFEAAGQALATQPGTNPAQNDPGQPAWTLDGRGIMNVPLPEGDISGPVLALAGGGDDLVPEAAQNANEIVFDLESQDRERYPGKALIYPDAGHAVGTFPYQPITTAAMDTLGGTRAGDTAAQ